MREVRALQSKVFQSSGSSESSESLEFSKFNRIFASEPLEFNRVAKIPKFMKWCEKNGINLDGLELRQNSNQSGIGVFATKELRPDDVVLIVPNDSMMTYQNCKSELGHLIPSSINDPSQVKKNFQFQKKSFFLMFCF